MKEKFVRALNGVCMIRITKEMTIGDALVIRNRHRRPCGGHAPSRGYIRDNAGVVELRHRICLFNAGRWALCTQSPVCTGFVRDNGLQGMSP